ncbi:DUF4192 domain-containing protein [Mycobacterium talmoniae]|uniref:DUF4192 domain-containing protein n=1 Tax=Mycobacterium talmoniae TaxID=1858794 RepID=A0A1S1NID4_9MYCO|nr:MULTISPECIES: DUF4192 domain-containing protein [Mycobacterium]OHV03617.1 hypothetical protein BKN37_14155 [Mycobacterium talmoniae]TDH47916.1 DUF4192 domain-containing protein [Mycobacterium eburneum]
MKTYRPDFELHRPGALIAALPAILGFVPEKSLVLVSVESGALGSVMRLNLADRLAERMPQLAQVAAAARPEAAIAVIVDAKGAGCPVCNADFRVVCAALTEALAQHDIVLWAAHVVDRVDAGGRWHCVDGCGARGVVDDPAASPLAVAAVLDGRRLYARRADLEAVIAVDDDRRAALEAVVAEQAAAREVARRADPDAQGRRDVRDAVAAAARVANGQPLDDAQLAALGCALTDVQVRDTLYGLAIGEGAAGAEELWAVLARVLPEPWRVEALVLLAFSAYVRGDGPLAGVSLEAALRCQPTHRMAGMLDTALQSGLRPDKIRQLAGTGYRLANRLGVRLPPRQGYRRRVV